MSDDPLELAHDFASTLHERGEWWAAQTLREFANAVERGADQFIDCAPELAGRHMAAARAAREAADNLEAAWYAENQP